MNTTTKKLTVSELPATRVYLDDEHPEWGAYAIEQTEDGYRWSFGAPNEESEVSDEFNTAEDAILAAIENARGSLSEDVRDHTIEGLRSLHGPRSRGDRVYEILDDVWDNNMLPSEAQDLIEALYAQGSES